jgi:hypothetical protein
MKDFSYLSLAPMFVKNNKLEREKWYFGTWEHMLLFNKESIGTTGHG